MHVQYCKHLRSKKLYVAAEIDDAYNPAADGLSNCGHCWCNRTMAEVGPDDRQVNADACREPRGCYED